MANKFNGILLCTDLDDTLLTSQDAKLSPENKSAIEYFMSEGGLFSFATGRSPYATKSFAEELNPNAPLICFNGGSLYDYSSNKVIWGEYLDKSALALTEYVEKEFPKIGIEIFTDNNVYFCKDNQTLSLYHFHESLPHGYLDYHNIFSLWKKIIFLCLPDEITPLMENLSSSEFAKDFDFTVSFDYYLEAIPKNISKGSALLKLTELLRISDSKTIGVGNYYNDISLLKTAGLGIAVANAVPELREIADIVTVDNNSNAISAIITSLDIGLIKF